VINSFHFCVMPWQSFVLPLWSLLSLVWRRRRLCSIACSMCPLPPHSEVMVIKPSAFAPGLAALPPLAVHCCPPRAWWWKWKGISSNGGGRQRRHRQLVADEQQKDWPWERLRRYQVVAFWFTAASSSSSSSAATGLIISIRSYPKLSQRILDKTL